MTTRGEGLDWCSSNCTLLLPCNNTKRRLEEFTLSLYLNRKAVPLYFPPFPLSPFPPFPLLRLSPFSACAIRDCYGGIVEFRPQFAASSAPNSDFIPGYAFPQQFLNFLPLPQGQGSFLPTFCVTTGACGFGADM